MKGARPPTKVLSFLEAVAELPKLPPVTKAKTPAVTPPTPPVGKKKRSKPERPPDEETKAVAQTVCRPSKTTAKARPVIAAPSQPLQHEQAFLARLLGNSDPKKILAGQKKAEECLRTIAGERLSPEFIHTSKLGITLQQLVNKCRHHSELAPLGSLVHKILLKLKAEITAILFGEEEFVLKPEIVDSKKIESEEARNTHKGHKGPVEHKSPEPQQPKTTEAKETPEQSEAKISKESKPAPAPAPEAIPSQSRQNESDDPMLSNPKDPEMMTHICQQLAKLLEEVRK